MGLIMVAAVLGSPYGELVLVPASIYVTDLRKVVADFDKWFTDSWERQFLRKQNPFSEL